MLRSAAMGEILDFATGYARRRGRALHPSAVTGEDALAAAEAFPEMDPDLVDLPAFACGRCRSQWWRLVAGTDSEGFHSEPIVRVGLDGQVHGWGGRLVCDGCGYGPVDGPA